MEEYLSSGITEEQISDTERVLITRLYRQDVQPRFFEGRLMQSIQFKGVWETSAVVSRSLRASLRGSRMGFVRGYEGKLFGQ